MALEERTQQSTPGIWRSLPAPCRTSADQQAKIEHEAADRLFGLLPTDQAAGFRALWKEFEAAETPDAKFAKAVDRLQPILLNRVVGGGTWTRWRS